jgi:hypothetical protein
VMTMEPIVMKTPALPARNRVQDDPPAIEAHLPTALAGVGGTTRVRGFGLRPGGDGVQDGDKARRGGDLGARARPR